jgi:hypothetical protein
VSELPVVLDLFSGTGSATQPFVECGKHRVIRIDIAGKPDVRADVRKLPLNLKERPEFIWASPPCTEFSRLTQLAVLRGRRGPMNPEKGMETFRAAYDFAESTGAYFIVENVLGAIPHVAPEYGQPKARIGAWALWGRFPGFLMPTSNRMYKLPLYYRTDGTGQRMAFRNRGEGHGDSGSARRAMIPRAISESVHTAFELSVCEGGT